MKKKLAFILIFIVAAIAGGFFYKKGKSEKFIRPLGYGYKKNVSTAKGEINNFALLDHLGNFQELYKLSDLKFIVIIPYNPQCSANLNQIEALNKIKHKFQDKGFGFFYILPDVNLNRKLIIEEAKLSNLQFPILLDPSQMVAHSLGFTNFREALVVSTIGWSAKQRSIIGQNLEALDYELQAISNNQFTSTNSIAKLDDACKIKYNFENSISYEKQIAPILMEKCLTCHTKQGKIPPFLDSYEKIKNWTEMSKETIMTERMPPISYDPLYGRFANDISLTNEEKRLLVQWYNAGAPKDSADDPVTKFRSRRTRQRLHPKDLVFKASMDKPHLIPPGGEIVYKYFQMGGPVPFDIWVKGYKTVSTNKRQLHHESLFVASKPLSFYENLVKKKFNYNEEKATKENKDGDVKTYIVGVIEGYDGKHDPYTHIKIQTYGAGKKEETVYPGDVGLFIPKGSYLILETHYMGTGKAETEQATIEFYGTKEIPKKMHNIRSLGLATKNFEIPPNNKNFEVRTRYWSPLKDIEIQTFLGHLHMRGKAVRMELTNEKGETRTIISIPNFYYGWQTGAALKPLDPIIVKKTDKLQAVCTYDNSAQNPFNPDPNKKVYFGQRVDRTEMCKMNITYIYK